MILLDTHVAVWMTIDRGQLSARAHSLLRGAGQAGEVIAIASSTLWEVALMAARHCIELPVPSIEYLRYIESLYLVLPITGAIAELSLRFEKMPRDPTDRIIGATAVIHQATLVTADKLIRDSGEVNCVW